MTNLQITIIYSSIIGSMLNEFEQTKKPIEKMKKRVNKFMYRRSRTNEKEFIEAIKAGNEIWVKAIDHFSDEKLSIDAFSTIIAVWSSQADNLSRFVNLSQKLIDSFSMLNDNDRLDAELDGYKVANYLNDEINKRKIK